MNFSETTATKFEIGKMSKRELKDYLESRGYYVAEGETIKEMRETAKADRDEEMKGKIKK